MINLLIVKNYLVVFQSAKKLNVNIKKKKKKLHL